MQQTFEVANIRCGGCANTIITKLEEAGFKGVAVDLTCEPRKVTVDFDQSAQVAHFRDLLRKLGYPMADENLSTINGAGLKAKSFVSCAVGKFQTVKSENN